MSHDCNLTILLFLVPRPQIASANMLSIDNAGRMTCLHHTIRQICYRIYLSDTVTVQRFRRWAYR